ncbi:MAG: FkbM family methyltransferase [Patescibacteria group bacterium]
MIKHAIWLAEQSITLDYKFFRVSKWSIFEKIHFTIVKYFLLIKHFFVKFNLGKDFYFFGGKKIYYDSKYGFAGYQSLLARHQNLIQLANIKNVEVVVDIGANVGFFTKLCRGIFPQSKIYSFEPVPRTFECLKNNLRDDANTSIYNLAISDYNGRAKMNFNEDDSVTSCISADGDVDVEVKTLDSFVEDNNINRIDILKIDTEEHELRVLKGASRALSKTKYLFIEIQIENNKYYTMSSLLKLLSCDAYDFQLVCFRNYNNTGEGRMRVMDALFRNETII